jgi:hypothetical protein
MLNQLTALIVLDTGFTPNIAAAGLLPLTSLRRLKGLTVMVGPTFGDKKKFAYSGCRLPTYL